MKYYWHESLERHVIFQKGERKALDIPLLVAIIAAVVAPWLAAGAVVVALILGYHITLHREEEQEPTTPVEGEEPAPRAEEPQEPTPPVPDVPPASPDLVSGTDAPPGQPQEPPPPQP